MTNIDTHSDKIGSILVKVQGDIQQLRKRFVDNDRYIRRTDFDDALKKTEDELQRKVEEVFNHINTQVKKIPFCDHFLHEECYISKESQLTLNSLADMNAPFCLTRQPQLISSAMRPGKQVQLKGLTPGQEHKKDWTLRAILSPQWKINRSIVKEHFEIQLPLINNRSCTKIPVKPILGSTVEHMTTLPRANRVDPQLPPPPIDEHDAHRGILSLLERGLIPSAAHLTLDPSFVENKFFTLHKFDEKCKLPISEHKNAVFNFHKSPRSHEVVIDEDSNRQLMPDLHSHVSKKRKAQTSPKTHVSSSADHDRTSLAVKTIQMPLQPVPPPSTPAIGHVTLDSHRFAIHHGKVRHNQVEFVAFKQHYDSTWGSITTMLHLLEKTLSCYRVPIVFIHGDKLARLSERYQMEKMPDLPELLSVIVNREDAEAIINMPGRRFLGTAGMQIAATKIQSSWRRYCDRSHYLDYRRRKWAAGVLALSWVMQIKMSRFRRQLKATRSMEFQRFKERAAVAFSLSWDRIKAYKHVIIHIPSLGLSQKIRSSIYDIGTRQNTQMARLCDILDPNVDVIFVSPVPLSDETLQYYLKLLGLISAVSSSNVDDQCDMSARYKVLVPEAVSSFPMHQMCLSTILKYSPCTLNRIASMIRGRQAYMVTGIPHQDDLSVADFLNVPILSPEPDVAHLYSTRPGCRRIFSSARIDVPPSEHDIYSLEQLHECLAQLVTVNLDVRRWLFKLNTEFDGRGIAFCDVTDHLKCFHWVQKEAKRYGDKWMKKWAQEAAFIKIHAEIPEILLSHAEPSNRKVFNTWQVFIAEFLAQGGIIEAYPPSDSVTTLTVNMLIEPNGRTQVVNSGDQIHAEGPFHCWGLSIPQTSVDPAILNAMCRHIGDACKSCALIGYIQIDFATYIDPMSLHQVVWALDLRPHYSDSVAMFQLVSYVTHGHFHAINHTFTVLPVKTSKRLRSKQMEETEEDESGACRYALLSTRLFHTNLIVVHYGVFFQMCRAHGIGYDVTEKQGTVVTLIDSFNRDCIGMITVGETLQGALSTFSRNLSVIHQEISTPNMQGSSNFQGAIEDIEGILTVAIQNSEEIYEALSDG